MSEPNTEPIPAPEPATPTVAAPAPMNLAAESISLETAEVWKFLTKGTKDVLGAATDWFWTRLPLVTAALRGLRYSLELEVSALLAAGATNLAQAYMIEGWF